MHLNMLGAKAKPTIKQAYKNALAFTKIVDGLIADPIPNNKSVPSVRSRNSDYPPMKYCDKDYKCTATQQVKIDLNKMHLRMINF